MAGGNVAVLWRPVRSNGLENPRSPVQYLSVTYHCCCCIKQWLKLFKAQLEGESAGKGAGADVCDAKCCFLQRRRDSVLWVRLVSFLFLKADAHFVSLLTAECCYI